MQFFAIQNIWRPENNLGIDCINRQIQKYVANHNKDGPKTKLKMKKFLTALSSVLYFMFYFPPYVLYGKRVVHFEKWTGGGKSTLVCSTAVIYCINVLRARGAHDAAVPPAAPQEARERLLHRGARPSLSLIHISEPTRPY